MLIARLTQTSDEAIWGELKLAGIVMHVASSSEDSACTVNLDSASSGGQGQTSYILWPVGSRVAFSVGAIWMLLIWDKFGVLHYRQGTCGQMCRVLCVGRICVGVICLWVLLRCQCIRFHFCDPFK